ncbi:MAG TPA: biopolymer transporter ExbD [Longimicrobium sp.]|nr:biopolymer transporter ExbD [Longimicrobium sp.]
MAMSSGRRRGGITADINVTPMIDVLLVLLIIFMVVHAGLQKGLSVQVPPPSDAAADPDTRPDRLVLELRADGGYALNHQPIARERLTETLRGVFANRPRKVLFIQAAETLTYDAVVQAVDAGRAAGIDVIGLVPRT